MILYQLHKVEANYLNVKTLNVNGNITASGGGKNYIYANSITTLSGAITTSVYNSGSSNAIVVESGNLSIGNSGDNSIGALNGGTSNSVELKNGNLTLTKRIYANGGNNTVSANQITISAGGIGNASGGTNTITINGSNSTNTISGGMTSGGGNNTITINSVTSTNTITGQVNASGNGKNTIEIASGDLTLSAGMIAQGYNASSQNTITLRSGNLIINNGTEGAIKAKNGGGSTNNRNIISVVGNFTANGNISVQSGSNDFSFSGQGEVTGNISIKSQYGGQNNFTLTSGTATLTLNGKTTGTAPTKHDITSLTATTSGTNTLTLDNTDKTVQDGTTTSVVGAMETTIHSITNGENLAVTLKGNGADKGATLILDNATGTTLKSVSLGTSSTANTLSFRNGVNRVVEDINVGSSNDLTINLQGATTSLNLKSFSKNGGTAKLDVSEANTNATLSGGTITADALAFNNDAKLSIQNGTSTFASASGSGTLSLDGKGAEKKVEVTIENKIDNGTNNLIANFNGSDKGENILNLNNGGTLKAVTLSDNSTNNTLNIGGSTKTTTIQDTVDVGLGSGITFNLANGTELALSGGSDARLGLAESKGNITVELASGATSAKLSGGGVDDATRAINITNLIFAGNSQTLTVENTSVSFGEVNGQNTGSSLTLDASANAVSATLHTIKGENLQVNLSGGAEVATLNLNGGTLKTLNISNGNKTANITNFKSNTTTITDKINIADSKGLTINLNGGSLYAKGGIATNTSGELKITMDGGKLSVGGGASTFATKSLTANNGAIIDLASVDSAGRPRASQARNKMTIEDYTQGSNATFVLYANGSAKQADQIVFKDSTNGTDKPIATISVVGGNDLFNVSYVEGGNENILVVDTKTNNAQDKVSIQNGVSVIGGIIAETQLVEGVESDKGNYYIGQVRDLGVKEELQEVASTVLTVNYDLYLANFNSLNKRMGELRENPHSNGVWARVFGGAMSNDFGIGSKTQYVTVQAGYDYGISVEENAKNYTGIAIAYGKSWTKSNSEMNANLVNNANTSLSNVDSNMVEVGVYNSYVADSGWYNDTIFKFDYIMSEFSLSNDPTMSKTNNFAMVLSDEFGYRYKFGSEKSWYIDPQVEVAFGYFNQSDFNRAVYDASHNATDLHASQDSILTLRSRAGLSLGKKFNTTKGFASLYVGAFYEYDYIEGGNAGASGRAGGTVTQLDKIESNGRAIVNVGSNIGLTESARLYIDVEKSFGDKQRTFM